VILITATPKGWAFTHSYATKSTMLTIGRPYKTIKLPLFVGDPHPTEKNHPWAHLTHKPKWHLNRINHHSTIQWTERQTNQQKL